ncbi:unnamed protein product [Periconia digitata]|uniref:Uncharacterized protein n=1 Tax=Periconia digitata TaxID=1303443 RepID=A0A9W4URB9_9PLEO|nr:unnamed protein product [Periconia digitata]
MEEPARKKRRTISPEPDERPSSPLKQPPRRPSSAFHTATGPDRLQSPLKQPPRRPSVSPTKARPDRSSSPLKKPPRRPSFASPTKASLARNYPNLLSRRSPSPQPVITRRNDKQSTYVNGTEVRARAIGSKGIHTGLEQDADTNGDSRKANGAARGLNSGRVLQTSRPVQREEIEPEESDLPLTPLQKEVSRPGKRRQNLEAAAEEPTGPSKQPRVEQQNTNGVKEVEELGENANENQKSPQHPDPALEQKKREMKQLTQELEELENQVSRCTEEIVKIQGQSPTHVLPPKEREDLISFIDTISKTSPDNEEEKPASLSNLLCSFLPFSTQTIPLPHSRLPKSKPVPSHRPLALDDPLPYLQMFTNLDMTTQLDLPKGETPSGSDHVHQKHTIQLTAPQKLLAATIDLVIDIQTSTIVDLQIIRLSYWAERELGTFIREKSLQHDLSNACWAIGSYWELARKRAEFWHKCEAAFAHLLPGQTNDDTENVIQRQQDAKTMSRKVLNRHLGRDMLLLQDHHVMLQLNWAIEFDWTGEANSNVGVRAAVPQVWTETDEGMNFDKIPETFDMLLQSKGAFAATKTMVALLFAEEQ